MVYQITVITLFSLIIVILSLLVSYFCRKTLIWRAGGHARICADCGSFIEPNKKPIVSNNKEFCHRCWLGGLKNESNY